MLITKGATSVAAGPTTSVIYKYYKQMKGAIYEKI